jgi:hypothetical protein
LSSLENTFFLIFYLLSFSLSTTHSVILAIRNSLQLSLRCISQLSSSSPALRSQVYSP